MSKAPSRYHPSPDFYATTGYNTRRSSPSMNTSGSEPQRAHGETGKRAPKANKSCLPCRVRKVKCDATVIGLPCSSCTSRQCAKDCVLHVRKQYMFYQLLAVYRPEESFTPRNCLWTKLPQLDDIDNEYLAKKGVFDLPPPQHFLHAPVDVLSACGFASRSAAQESFFSKAKLLHDFAAEDDPLLMLQGSIILCMVILDHPTDRDFSYWFHNAIRLATKLDLRDTRSRLLENTSAIKPRTEDDWEAEDVSGVSSGLLSVVTPQQKALPVALCELSRIFGQCLSIVINKPHQDPRQMMHPLDTWRKSLANKMHVGGSIGTDVYYLNIQAMSYRFECILCRLIRRRLQQSQHADWSEWAKERLRSAILELDMISMRVLANGTLQDFPMPFITTITALLALHIESALDPAETDLVRSMARISISQTMLVLTQGKEIPALKRALPVFEEILAKKNLYPVQPSVLGQAPTQSQSQDNIMADAYTSPNTQFNIVPSQLEQGENNLPLYGDFLGLDFLDDWRLGSWNSLFDVDMGSQEQTE
ncbi:fusaric acid cluster transcription factor FUB12 [Trichoderma asperellum]|uniref:Fusaric acid cluster transcription factor FUB12 n=1 Tax=Trichoderma asperellum TaxID=101201 RepID=A0A6V8QI69_TRIAP|nr:fusaric acid cluster transcription factor FUB12 [Trichoderma asperellum]